MRSRIFFPTEVAQHIMNRLEDRRVEAANVSVNIATFSECHKMGARRHRFLRAVLSH